MFVSLLHTSIWFIDIYRGNDNNNSKHHVTCHSADIQEAIVPHSSIGEQFFHTNSSSGTVGKNCKLDTMKCPISHVKGQYSASIHQGKKQHYFLVPFRIFNPVGTQISHYTRKTRNLPPCTLLVVLPLSFPMAPSQPCIPMTQCTHIQYKCKCLSTAILAVYVIVQSLHCDLNSSLTSNTRCSP